MSYPEKQIMEIPQSQLMEDARDSLSGRWGLAISTYLVLIFLSIAANLVPYASILVAGPFALGIAMFSLKLARDEEAELNDIFDGFQYFVNALAAHLLMMLFVVLGMIFFIVPGIIIALGLSQTMFILADNPELSPIKALEKSWEMMKGYKWDYFIMGLRFIPLFFLCILSLFIGFLWLAPYMQVSYANYYDALKYAHGEEDLDDDISRHLVSDQ